jgi:anti-sigma B factor antagonist
VVVTLSGELTIKEAPQLRDQLLMAIRSGAEVVVADLDSVSFVDQTAIGVFVGARTRLVANGGELRLAGVRPKLVRVISLLGLEGDLPVFPTVEAALAAP